MRNSDDIEEDSATQSSKIEKEFIKMDINKPINPLSMDPIIKLDDADDFEGGCGALDNAEAEEIKPKNIRKLIRKDIKNKFIQNRTTKKLLKQFNVIG